MDIDSGDKKLYEVGFLLSPALVDESLNAAVDKLNAAITNNGGEVTLSGTPEMRELAYSITKEINRKKHQFDKAYFGWIRFLASPSEVSKINDLIDSDDDVVRFILITAKKVKPNTKAPRKAARKPKAETGEAKADEKEIDQELDAILGEEKKEPLSE